MDYFADLAVHGAFFVSRLFCLPTRFWSSIHHCSITLELPIYSLRFLPSNGESCVGFMLEGDAATNGRRALDIKQALRALDGASIALSRRNKRSEIQLS